MAKKSFPLRIDDQVFEQLRQWADDEFRSVNGQIEYLLREALRQAGRAVKKRAADGPPIPGDTSEETDRPE